MSESPDGGSLYQFTLQEAVRALDAQQEERARIRDRGVATLGLMGVLSTFVVEAILDSSEGKNTEFWWFMAGLTCLFAVQFVLWLHLAQSELGAGPLAWIGTIVLRQSPLPQWSAKSSARDLVEIAARDDFDDSQKYRHLATTYDEAGQSNEVVLSHMRFVLLVVRLAAATLMALLMVALWRLG